MHHLRLNSVAKAIVAPTPMCLGEGHILDTLGGRFTVEVWRGDKFISRHFAKNGITNEGKDKALGILFDGVSAIANWYLGLINLTSFSALAAGDTYAQIGGTNGWVAFTTYTDPQNSDSTTTHPEWAPDAPSSQSITNGTVRNYDITTSGTVKGLYVVGGGSTPSTKNDNAGGGTLWSTALFTGGDVAVSNGETLKVTYTVSA